MALSDSDRAREQQMEAQVTLLLKDRRVPEACALIVEVLGPPVLGFLRARTGSVADGDELFSELCETLLRKLASFEGRSSVKTWLYAVARHLAIRHFERYSQRPGRRRDLDSVPDALATGLSTLLERAERQQLVTWVLAQLTEEERDLLVLRVDQEFSFHQVGQIMGISPDNARQRFQRMKTRLKDLAARGPAGDGEGSR